MRRWLAGWVAKALDSRGYTLTRPRFHEENEIDLRGMLADRVERRHADFVALQIGANDGQRNDPIHDLVLQRKWQLYAIEPVPAPFARLQITYDGVPGVHCIQCAVGHEDGEQPLYVVRAEPGEQSLDQLASFSRDTLMKHWRRIPQLEQRIETITVPTMTLPSLLQENAIRRVDLLQIDTEGFDYEIVKMAFAAELFPAILCFEWEHLSQPDMWDCRTALIDNGYRWLIVKGDIIATRLTRLTRDEPAGDRSGRSPR